MVPSRGLTVLAALVSGVVAGTTAYAAAHSTVQQAFPGQKLATVYVVRGTVPAHEAVGAAYAQGRISSMQVPVRYVPDGAVTDLGGLSNRVARATLGTGVVLADDLLTTTGATPARASHVVPRGDVAVTVSVDPATGVAGFVQPGDHVDILVDLGTEEAFLYRSVSVLAVDQRLVAAPGTTSGTAPSNGVKVQVHLVTLAMSPAAAAHIPPTHSNGSVFTPGVYLALDPPGTAPTTVSPVDAATLIPGLDVTLEGQGINRTSSGASTTGNATSGTSTTNATTTTGNATGGTGATGTGVVSNTSGPNRAQNVATP